MNISVKINRINTEGNVKAVASATLDDSFAVRGIKIVDGKKGLFLDMPSYKTSNGEYKDICFPVSAEFRQQLSDVVIGAYKNAISQLQNQAAAPISTDQGEDSENFNNAEQFDNMFCPAM